MSADPPSFRDSYFSLTGHPEPMAWQRRLFDLFVKGDIPAALDLPTGLGKTSVMAIWLLARAFAKEALKDIPRRLIYVVDRRAVVDQATEVADTLCDALDCNDAPESKAEHLKRLQPDKKAQVFGTLRALKTSLGIGDTKSLPISTLRGAHVDNREWLDNPAAPAVIVGTVDMIGSRLLFEGYGVSRKMRPYHAGLLGADAFIVLDEAHLVPPFVDLLRAIESEGSLWPDDRAPLPRFVVLPLSATQRERPAENDGRKPFGLEEEDWRDETAAARLNARKHLCIEPLAENDHDKQLAQAAFKLATEGRPARVVVFCNRREKRDDGVGPSAQGVAEVIKTLADGDKKTRRDKIDIDRPELLVGARRVYEREQVARTLQELGFMGHGKPPERPAFLVATSAGEVGIDFDADHMVCDLAPWERMVQRLGRVNRRGGGGHEAQVVVFDTSGIEKDKARKARLIATRDLLSRIATDFGDNAGPAMLLELRRRIGGEKIEKASTPEPLHPALTRALVDAWSMTSLEQHTGRPDVAPWLRGWVEPDYQTVVIWRSCLPVREGIAEWPWTSAEKKEIEEFFEAAPPHESEKLETETFRVADWLEDRAATLLQRKPSKAIAEPANRDEKEASGENAKESGTKWQGGGELQPKNIVAIVLSASAEYESCLTLQELKQDRKGRAKEEFHDRFVGKILVMDARFGGLKDGMLDNKADSDFPIADASDEWSKETGFRVRRTTSDHGSDTPDWSPENEFVLRRNEDGEMVEWLLVEHFKNAAQSEDGLGISPRPQALADHQELAKERARHIGQGVGLSGVALEALTLAAFVHDEGKRARRWQQAFKARRDAEKFGLSGPLAKTRGPIDQAVLDGYRHEFGSLAVFEPENIWAKQLPARIRKRIDNLPAEWRDLMQHLIAAHHGSARPVVATNGCEDAPPSALEERAREVALRFARLQKRWGPWGLAWWEALLRAADQQASRDNDRREVLDAVQMKER